MLLLMQSAITASVTPQPEITGAGWIRPTPTRKPIIDDDDEILMAWFTYMARYYGKSK